MFTNNNDALKKTTTTSAINMIGEGTVICAGTIITCNIKIGDFVTFNLLCSVGHDTIINDFITSLASELGKEIINLDEFQNNLDWQNYLSVDEDKYNRFINLYIKEQGTARKPVWEIVIDRMESDLFT